MFSQMPSGWSRPADNLLLSTVFQFVESSQHSRCAAGPAPAQHLPAAPPECFGAPWGFVLGFPRRYQALPSRPVPTPIRARSRLRRRLLTSLGSLLQKTCSLGLSGLPHDHRLPHGLRRCSDVCLGDDDAHDAPKRTRLHR